MADFHLDVVEDGRVVLPMRVIVERGYGRTPESCKSARIRSNRP